MDEYLIVTQSITQAQHMQRVLDQVGIGSRIVRGHRAITPSGCGYTLQVAGRNLPAALLALRRASLEPLGVYRYYNGMYQEVTL